MRKAVKTVETKGPQESFLSDESGAVLILIATTMSLILGIGALGIDYSMRRSKQIKMQLAADSASINAASAIASLSPDNLSLRNSVCENEISALTASLSLVNGVNGITVTSTGCASGDYIKVLIVENADYPLISSFSRLLGKNVSGQPYATAASAVARIQSSALYCSLALGKNGANYDLNYATSLQGNATVQSNNCGIADNSKASCAFYAQGSVTVNVPVSVAGGACGNQSNIQNLAYGRPVEDPFLRNSIFEAALDASYPSSNAIKVTSGMTTLSPGHYDNIPKSQNLALAPGTYYFDNISVNSGSLTGSGVTVIFKKTVIFPNNMGNFYVTPPTSGVFSGVSIASLSQKPFSLYGQTNLSGSVYMPNASVSYYGTSQSTCTQIVANQIFLIGNSNMQNDLTNCPFFMGSQIQRKKIQLIQ